MLSRRDIGYLLTGLGLGCALIGFWLVSASPVVGQTGATEAPYVPGEVLVLLKPGAVGRLTGQAAAWAVPGVKAVRPARYGRLLRLSVAPGQESAVIAGLKASGAVDVAALNHLVYAQEVPDDPDYALQWALPRVDAPAAWDLITGTRAITVAIVDSGLDTAHPEFSGRLVAPWDVIDDDTDPEDTCDHGTHVAGILGATGNNGTGIAGMAWNVNLMPVRVLGGTCSGSEADVAAGIDYAVAHGAQVINLSLGANTDSTCEERFPVMSRAVQDAYTAGRLVVAAAGNSGAAMLLCPARQVEALAVGATTPGDELAGFSNYGEGLDLVAPGDSIYSTLPGDGYGYKSGTSMATPHVAGLAALVWSLAPDLAREEVRAILEVTADDLGAPGWDQYFGFGRINAGNALVPDLIMRGQGAPNPVLAGQLLTYTLVVTNVGPLTATAIVLTQTIPVGLEVAWLSAGCSSAAETITCTLDSLPPTQVGGFQTVASVLEPTRGVITSNVRIGAQQPDPPTGNTAVITVTVASNPVTETLWLAQGVTPTAPRVGQALTYTLTAANLACGAGSEASGVVLTDSLVSAVVYGWAVTESAVECAHTDGPGGGTVVCNLGTLGRCDQPTSTAVVHLVVTPTVFGPITNTACLGSQRAGPQAVCVRAGATVRRVYYFPLILRDVGSGEVIVQP